MKLTTKEENLIIAIRNFRESLHNPSEELEKMMKSVVSS